jgi:hypothetical protein
MGRGSRARWKDSSICNLPADGDGASEQYFRRLESYARKSCSVGIERTADKTKTKTGLTGEWTMPSDPKSELLRHTVATLAYRGAKAVRNAPLEFAAFQGVERTPGQILSHIGDLLDWALSMAEGKQRWQDSETLPWDKEVDRFFAGLKAFDDYLASGKPLAAPPERLFQGPIADH